MAISYGGPHFYVPIETRRDRNAEANLFAHAVREDIRPQGALEDLMIELILDAAQEYESELAEADSSIRRDAGQKLTSAIHALLGIRCLRRSQSTEPEIFSDEETEPVRWETRLCWELSVSEESPTIRGTWITVNDVITKIVDGWSWADLLRAHPELCTNDLRACLAYTIEVDGMG